MTDSYHNNYNFSSGEYRTASFRNTQEHDVSKVVKLPPIKNNSKISVFNSNRKLRFDNAVNHNNDYDVTFNAKKVVKR